MKPSPTKMIDGDGNVIHSPPSGPSLFDRPLAASAEFDGERALTPEEQFHAFHKANPQVYGELVGRTRALVRRGYRHLGIRMVWESMRFDFMVTTDHKPGTPKLNDHFPPFYSRLIMKSHPDLAGVFETRDAESSSNQTIQGGGGR